MSHPPVNIANLPTVPDTPMTSVGNEGGSLPETHREGDLLDGRHKILRVLGGPGQSGMGVVYVVETRHGVLAAKTFQAQFAHDMGLIERFLREAQTWLLLGFHQNIVHALSLEIIDAVPFIFMEYITPDSHGGVSLADCLLRGPTPLEEGLRLALNCCDGMIHAQACVPGLVHRDLKPENLLIRGDGVLKITDFGLVRSRMTPMEPKPSGNGATPANLTQIATTIGTPAYMAPEQFTTPGSVTFLADMYAFGCCFYELLSGERLFSAPSGVGDPMALLKQLHLNEKPTPLQDRLPGCPDTVNTAIMRCLAKNPWERWPSFAALREALCEAARCTGMGAICAPPQPPSPKSELVGLQFNALARLEGYARAVRMPRLRAGHHRCPYSFHLALSSYFRVQEQRDEEQRQLEKAVRARRSERGDEAVRRLAENHLAAGDISSAEDILTAFLAREPLGAELVTEPRVLLAIAQSDAATASALLEGIPLGPRRTMLWVRYHQKFGSEAELLALLQQSHAALLRRIESALTALAPGDSISWDSGEDPELLRSMLPDLLPQVDPAILDQVTHLAWPDMTAMVDLSGVLAWLSEISGFLGGEAGAALPECDRGRHQCHAEMLGYPGRLRQFMERDEGWLWTE